MQPEHEAPAEPCYEIIELPIEGLDRLEPLWRQLNALHWRESPYFRRHHESITFADRKAAWIRYGADRLIVAAVRESASGALLGYCVSGHLADGRGEIESLYVDDSLRGRGFGSLLVRRHVAALRERGCGMIRVAVSYGHESVFGFYEKLGFYPRLTYLEMRDPQMEPPAHAAVPTEDGVWPF